MLRTHILALLAVAACAGAPTNGVTITPAATQTNRPFIEFSGFAPDEICNYPAPYVNGSLPALWQTDIHSRWPASSRCPSGAVRFAHISWYHTTTATTAFTVDYRDHANQCSSGNTAACNAASLTQSGMVNFNSGSWDAGMTVSAYPVVSLATPRSVAAKTMINAGHWSYRLRGPVVTQVVAEDRSTSLTYDFGWIPRRIAIQDRNVSFYIQANDTSAAVVTAAHWSGIARPFLATIESEIVSICYVDSTRIYFGTTNGSDATCANVNGRGTNGTTAALHTGQPFYLREAVYLTQNIDPYQTTFTVNNTAQIVGANNLVFQIGHEKVKLCGATGLTVSVCSGGRGYYGTANSNLQQRSGLAVYPWYNATNLSSDVWVDAPTAGQRSLHPIFVVSFFPTFNGVSTEYHIANVWTGKLQDQEYNVNFYTGAGNVTYVTGKTFVRHVPNTMWKYPDGPVVGLYQDYVADRAVWQAGAIPGSISKVYDRDYFRYLKLVPNDFTISLSQTGLNNVLTTNVPHSTGTTAAWNNGQKSAMETGQVLEANPSCGGPTFRPLAQPGIRQDIGVNPTWSLTGLYAMGSGLTGASRWYEWTIGAGAASGYPPYIFWEDNPSTSLKFCAGGNSVAQPTAYSCTGANLLVDAFGKPISIDARPSTGAATSTASPIYSIGITTYNYWEMNDYNGHMPELLWIPWLLTGDWYYETVGISRAAWTLYAANQYPNYNPNDAVYWTIKQYRKGDWGVIGPIGAGGGPRNIAWGLRNLANGTILARDSTPEKEYLTKKLNTNLAVWEGKFNITDGSYYLPCPQDQTCSDDYSPWLYGRRRLGYGLSTMATFPLLDSIGGGPLNDQPALIDPAITRAMSSFWSEGYGQWVLGDIVAKGFSQATKVHAKLAGLTVNLVMDPANQRPLNIASYRMPMNPCLPLGCGSFPQALGQEFLFSSIANWFNGWTTLGKTTYYSTVYTDSPSDPQGRPWMMYSALALASGVTTDSGYTGRAAWDRWRSMLPFQNTAPNNPTWYSAPNTWYEITNLRVSNIAATTATIYFTRPAPSNSCGYYVGTAFPYSNEADTGSITNTPGGFAVNKALTGLTTATQYWVRVTCGAARGYTTFTTE